MKLNIAALAGACALVWGLALLLSGLLAMTVSGYAQGFLDMCTSIYPGYDADGSVGDLLVGTLYALADGAVAGAFIALVYNLLAARRGRA